MVEKKPVETSLRILLATNYQRSFSSAKYGHCNPYLSAAIFFMTTVGVNARLLGDGLDLSNVVVAADEVFSGF